MDGEVEIAANVGMFASDYFKMILGGEVVNIGVWSGGGDDDLTGVILVRDGFDAGFEVRAFLIS